MLKDLELKLEVVQEEIKKVADKLQDKIKVYEKELSELLELKDNEVLVVKGSLYLDRLVANTYLLDNEGKQIFGTGADLYIERGDGWRYEDHIKDYNIKLNYGTTGSFNRADTYRIQNLEMIARVASKLKEAEDLSEKFFTREELNHNLVLLKQRDNLDDEIRKAKSDARWNVMFDYFKTNNKFKVKERSLSFRRYTLYDIEEVEFIRITKGDRARVNLKYDGNRQSEELIDKYDLLLLFEGRL